MLDTIGAAVAGGASEGIFGLASSALSSLLSRESAEQASADSLLNNMAYDKWKTNVLSRLQLQNALGNYAYNDALAKKQVVTQREALEQAGYNPLLAVESGGSAPQVPMLGSSTSNGATQSFSAGQSRVDAKLNLLEKYLSIKSLQSQLDKTNIENINTSYANDSLRMDSMINEVRRAAEYEALTGTPIAGSHEHGGGFEDLVHLYRNEIQSGRYTSSLEHAVFTDINNTAKTVSDFVPKSTKYIKPSK